MVTPWIPRAGSVTLKSHCTRFGTGDSRRSQRPPLPILPAQVLRRLVVIRDPPGLGVVLDAGAEAVGDVAEEDGLAQAAAVIEVAGGGAAVADGVEPFAMMADRARDGRLGRLEIAELGLRQQAAVAVIGEQAALLPFEEHAAVEVLV